MMDDDRLAELLRTLPSPPAHVVDAVLRLPEELGPLLDDADDELPGGLPSHDPPVDWHEPDPGPGGSDPDDVDADADGADWS